MTSSNHIKVDDYVDALFRAVSVFTSSRLVVLV